MASGHGRTPGEQPPTLPVKHRRSHSSRHSSVESDCAMFDPVGLQHQNEVYNNVFPEPTDCHADQCPIHQRYDSHRHQVRYFSDDTPPPVPKKRLNRTLSLPGTDAPTLSPLSPLGGRPRNIDNPLYMLAPIPDTCLHEETEEFKPVPASSLSLSQLSFDTPDEHLPYLFSSIGDQRVVFQGIQHRHLLFLRTMAQSMGAWTLLQQEGQAGSYQGREPEPIRHVIYYSLYNPTFKKRVLGIRAHKHTDETSKALTGRQPSHINFQDDIAHLEPGNIPSHEPGQTQDPSPSSKSDCTATKLPGGGSSESTTDGEDIHSLLQKGHSVSIERNQLHGTLEDFVQENRSPQGTNCSEYDRQLCVVLLQVLLGSQHLYNICARAAELRPQEILLVWPDREKGEGENKQGQGASEMRTGSKTTSQKGEMERGKKSGKFQMLWRTLGSPRVVLTPLSSAPSAPEALAYIKNGIGGLITYCLDSRERQTATDRAVPTLSQSSLYRSGLIHVASLLQSENKSGPPMADMVTTLRVLLWGPSISLLSHRGPGTISSSVHNWLTIKRALLVMKLAERGLIQDESVLDWEDCMCLQYLSFTDTESLTSVTSQLYGTL